MRCEWCGVEVSCKKHGSSHIVDIEGTCMYVCRRCEACEDADDTFAGVVHDHLEEELQAVVEAFCKAYSVETPKITVEKA